MGRSSQPKHDIARFKGQWYNSSSKHLSHSYSYINPIVINVMTTKGLQVEYKKAQNRFSKDKFMFCYACVCENWFLWLKYGFVMIYTSAKAHFCKKKQTNYALSILPLLNHELNTHVIFLSVQFVLQFVVCAYLGLGFHLSICKNIVSFVSKKEIWVQLGKL